MRINKLSTNYIPPPLHVSPPIYPLMDTRRKETPLNPQELKLIHEYELVEVEPLSTLLDLDLLSGYIPSCSPLSITKLPYFVALPLKESNLLQIRLPSFLVPDNLKAKIEEEKANKGEYAFVHESLFVLGKEIARNSYNAEDVLEINILIDQLKEIRFRKTLQGLEALDGSTLNLNNLTVFEFNEVKTFIRKAMGLLKRVGE